jgi:uncharacterized SAM-binding protein YcdF (DUF218 family)
MFHTASKILFLIFQPSSLAVIAIATGLALAARTNQRSGPRVIAIGLAWILFTGFLPLGNALVLPLEERFGSHQPSLPHGEVTGIIILGGFEDGWVTAGRGGLAINEAAERLTEGLRIARLLPNAKVIFTGGVGALFDDKDAGWAVRNYLIDAGVAPERIITETSSRNTYENALNTRDLLKSEPHDRWLLVTSAYHMPRAVGTFRQLGFNVIPLPVDFRTRNARDVWRPFASIGAGLERTDLAAKEWIGLVAYYLTGRSAALFPGPVAP